MIKRILLALATIAALLAAAFLLRTSSDFSGAPSQEPKSGSAGKFFEPASETLPAAKASCAKPADLDEGDNLWTDDESGAFVSYHPQSRIITVCDKGRAVAGVWPADPEIADIELVRVSDSGLEDMNGDGKKESFSFQGQCAEGPCIGFHYLPQVDGAQIRKLYTLYADTAVTVHEGGKTGIFLQKNCYTHDFTPGPAYFAVAEFSPDLRLVPFQQLRARYPEASARLQPGEDVGQYNFTPQQQSMLELQRLIAEAYNGKPAADLLKLLPPPETLNLYCDMPGILSVISGIE